MTDEYTDTVNRPSAADTSLLAPHLIASEHRQPPAVIVGLPRSGSTYLSYVLSQLREWYFVDDMYIVQHAQSIHARGTLDEIQIDSLLNFLGRRTVRQFRIIGEGETESLENIFTDAEVNALNQKLAELVAPGAMEWPALLEEWMLRITRHLGRSRWGWKTPQDFHHMEMLRDLFPGVKFIFLLRDPRKTMASLKYVPKNDGDRRQYHPVAYAQYWKMAVEHYKRFAVAHPEDILFVRLEDVTAQPDQTVARIAEFLGATVAGKVPVREPNSSFRSGDRKTITPTEAWICDHIARNAMREAGYEVGETGFRLRDLPDLLRTTTRFTAYQTRRLLTNPKGRVQILAYLKSLRKF